MPWGGAETLIFAGWWSAPCEDPPHPMRDSGTLFTLFLIKRLLMCHLDRAVGFYFGGGNEPDDPLANAYWSGAAHVTVYWNAVLGKERDR